ncbi:hypothetical protein [Halorubellus sp. PRR65]|uniref:hypothetical protein n=2 Tax=Halobacteriales TaxID=2235 RepID=UPI002B25A13F|nr:hypothetical protein [Halorubellus sp. PRR65]
MEEMSRRGLLRSAAAAGTTTVGVAMAGCAALDGDSDGSGGEYRSTITHPGWFDASQSAAAPDGYRLDVVITWDLAALRDIDADLPEWLEGAGTNRMPGIDQPMQRQTFTAMPHPVRVTSYADAEALRTAARESDAYAPVDGLDEVYGHADEHGVTVVGDGVAVSVDRYDGDQSASPVDDVAAHAKMLAAREDAEFATASDALSRTDRLVDAVGTQTIARLRPRRTNLEIGLKGVGEGFTVGPERTQHRAVGLGDDLDPDTFKQRRLSGGSDYAPYDDVSVSGGDGTAVLEGSVPTSEFDMLSRY